MKRSGLSAAIVASFGIWWTLSAACADCCAANVYFIPDVVPPIDGDFNSAANWSNGLVPSLVPTPPSPLPNVYGIDDGLSSTFFGGSTTVQALRVGSAAKEHPAGDIHFGRLAMTGGSLSVIGNNTLVVGRENQYWYPVGGDYNKNTVVDAADYAIWRKTLGSTSNLAADGDNNGVIEQADYDFWRARFGNVVRGGEIVMTGSSTLKAYGVLIGERSKGLLSVSPNAVVESRVWFPGDETYDDYQGTPPVLTQVTISGPHFSPIGTENIHIGGYGPAFDTFGSEPGLDGDGLVAVQGTLNANAMYVSEHGAKGELRLSGGTVNLNGALIMSYCDACVPNTTPDNMALLAFQSSKVSIIGSTGSFKVGIKPLPLVPDEPSTIKPFIRDIRFNRVGGAFGYPATATFSFTADAGGVTPIAVVDNGVDIHGAANYSGTAYIGGTKLQLNLDAYTSASPLTLIDAPAGLVVDPAPADPTPHYHLVGTFGSITFLGSRWADVIYDYANGNVYLNNFRIGPGAGTGSLASFAVPEPSSLVLMPLALHLLLFVNYRVDRRTARCWGYQCQRVRA